MYCICNTNIQTACLFGNNKRELEATIIQKQEASERYSIIKLSVGSKIEPKPSPKINIVSFYVFSWLFDHFKKVSFVPSWEFFNSHNSAGIIK